MNGFYAPVGAPSEGKQVFCSVLLGDDPAKWWEIRDTFGSTPLQGRRHMYLYYVYEPRSPNTDRWVIRWIKTTSPSPQRNVIIDGAHPHCIQLCGSPAIGSTTNAISFGNIQRSLQANMTAPNLNALHMRWMTVVNGSWIQNFTMSYVTISDQLSLFCQLHSLTRGIFSLKPNHTFPQDFCRDFRPGFRASASHCTS